jgi:hypothetical protein
MCVWGMLRDFACFMWYNADPTSIGVVVLGVATLVILAYGLVDAWREHEGPR